MKKLDRRQFLGSTAALVVLAPSFLIAGRANAGGHLPKVDPNDPQAKALSYVHESPKADNICANCQLYTGAEPYLEWENDKPTVMALREISAEHIDATVLSEPEDLMAASLAEETEVEVNAPPSPF